MVYVGRDKMHIKLRNCMDRGSAISFEQRSLLRRLKNFSFIQGLVDTAVKTAETGYMQRRLVKVSF